MIKVKKAEIIFVSFMKIKMKPLSLILFFDNKIFQHLKKKKKKWNITDEIYTRIFQAAEVIIIPMLQKK